MFPEDIDGTLVTTHDHRTTMDRCHQGAIVSVAQFQKRPLTRLRLEPLMTPPWMLTKSMGVYFMQGTCLQ